VLPEEVEEEVRAAAEISMGTEVCESVRVWGGVCIINVVLVFQISEEDILNIAHLCEQVSPVGKGGRERELVERGSVDEEREDIECWRR